MHVAYIHQHFSTTRGATGTRSYEMSRRLLAAGHRVTVVCGVNPTSAGSFKLTGAVNELEIDGIHVVCLAEPYSNQMGFLRRVRAFGRFARRAEGVVRGARPDLVFATSTPLTVGLPGMKAARALGVPFVFEVRDLWPELPIAMGIIRNPLLKAYLRRMERRIYAAAQGIIACAPGIREGIVRTGYPAGQIALIPNASDLDLFQPDSRPLDDPRFGAPGEFRLVFTGAHGQANGLDAVLDAIEELRRRGAKGLRFCFIGDGALKPRLVQRSRSAGLDGMVTWAPLMPKGELARVLPRMDVGLMVLANVPAFYYGTSPNKFFDYLACGLPVLNNYPGWLAEMIQEHGCGVAVPPGDPVAFADAVLELQARRAELPAMGARARRLGEERFSRDELGRVFVETLERARAEFRRPG